MTRIIFAPLAPESEWGPLSGSWGSSDTVAFNTIFEGDDNCSIHGCTLDFYSTYPYWPNNEDEETLISMFEYEVLHFDRKSNPTGPWGDDTHVCGSISHIPVGIDGSDIFNVE